jgi:predicted phage terminase large subunit-like protein
MPKKVAETQIIQAQEGPQQQFLATSADIAIFGGSAGGGKTFGLLLEPLRHKENPDFGAVIFRKTYPQVTNEGGLWDESSKVYPLLKAQPNKTEMAWIFPSGMKVKFGHLADEATLTNWQGSQIAMIAFDELTHFSEKVFFWMLSRNRTDSGVQPYVRATCNPDADSWVATFIAWWIGEDGYAIPERSGVIRWFARANEILVWGDSAAEVLQQIEEMGLDPTGYLPKSVTFILSTLYDNKILMKNDPGYLANLLALPKVERERLLGDKQRGGNWKIREEAGKIFQMAWLSRRYTTEELPAIMLRLVQIVLSIDTAYKTGVTSDYTAMAVWGTDGIDYFLLYFWMKRVEYPQLKDQALLLYATWHPHAVLVEDASAGMSMIQELRQQTDLPIIAIKPVGSKVMRAETVSPTFEAYKVVLPPNDTPWLDPWVSQHVGFPTAANDDAVDTTVQFLQYVLRRGFISVIDTVDGSGAGGTGDALQDLLFAMAKKRQKVELYNVKMPVDVYVSTHNPAALDSFVQFYGAMLATDERGIYYQAANGMYLMRIFENAGFLQFAIENQGYGRITEITERFLPSHDQDDAA